MMRILFLVILAVAILILGVFSYAYFQQHKLVFFPEKLQKGFRFELGPGDEEGFLELPTGEKINYLLYVGTNSAEATKTRQRTGQILYFHGNAGSLASWSFAADEIRRKTGWTVWIMDYPGYGKSSGETRDEKILLSMGKHFIKTVQAQNPNGKLVLYGRSIGSGVASALASEPNIKALILETPYLTIQKLAKEIFPLLPASLTRINLDNEQVANYNPIPRTLIFHGTKDEVIPYQQGKQLSELIKGAKLITTQNGTHSNLSQDPQYWTELNAFLQTID